MRLRRPIAFILSAALAAGALTGCSWEEFLEWLNRSSLHILPPSLPPESSAGQASAATHTVNINGESVTLTEGETEEVSLDDGSTLE